VICRVGSAESAAPDDLADTGLLLSLQQWFAQSQAQIEAVDWFLAGWKVTVQQPIDVNVYGWCIRLAAIRRLESCCAVLACPSLA